MTIEIMDFPIKNGDFPVRYVSLPGRVPLNYGLQGMVEVLNHGMEWVCFCFPTPVPWRGLSNNNWELTARRGVSEFVVTMESGYRETATNIGGWCDFWIFLDD